MTTISNEYIVSDISSVLKLLLSRFDNLSGSELAKRIGLPISTVNRILAGSVSDPRISTLKPLADYFGITVDQLLGYTALPEKYAINNLNLNPSIVIPMFRLNNYYASNEPIKSFTWVTQKNETEAFAILIDHSECEPIFEKDTILVIEPNLLPPQHNDYLLIRFNNKNSLSIRKFLIDENDKYLVPLNSQLKATKLNEQQYSILGVITEAHTKLRD